MTAPTTRPTTEGTFSKTPLPNVLLYAREKKMTGTFVVSNPPPTPGDADDDGVGESIIVVEGGVIVAVQLPRFAQNLGWVMHDLGLLTDDTFIKVQQSLDEPGAEEIPTLLRLGAADPTTLETALREQLRRKVVALFGNSQGTYAYYDKVDLLGADARARTPQDVFPIVWRGLQASPPTEAAMAVVFEKIGQRGLRLREGHEFERFEFGVELGLAPTQLRTAPSSLDQLIGLAPDAALVRIMVYLLALTKQIEAVSLATAASNPASNPAPATPLSATLGAPKGPASASGPPSGESSVAPTSDPKAKEARTHLGRMENWTYFEMFDLTPSATMEDIQKRFPVVAAAWHPDRANTNELRTLHTEIFGLYNHAFTTLSDLKSRMQYEETIAGGGGTPAAQKRVNAVLDTVQEAHRAEIALNRKDYVEAERMLRRVLETNPDDIAVNALLCKCLLETNPAPHLDDIVNRLAKILRATDSNDQAQYLMGMVCKVKSDKRAYSFFKKALEINPNNLDAQREVRIIEMRHNNRKEAANNPVTKITNMFNSIFGGKK
ncbi:MAG: repeat/DnaJ domain/tetratricopeptide repeat protein [Myxococcaceae bacterium]|nr:repeat/DnaJ domain/tetratricopeptide repeat protein [Myxococcaceae bacterium]